MRIKERLVPYTAVSVVATALAQGGLVVAYGLLRWGVLAAVAFSLVVSVGPAYVLSRRFVWRAVLAPVEAATRAAGFFVVAAAGSAATVAIVWLAVQAAKLGTTDHAALAFVANGASLGATVVVWGARYLVLDRLLFAGPRFLAPLVTRERQARSRL